MRSFVRHACACVFIGASLLGVACANAAPIPLLSPIDVVEPVREHPLVSAEELWLGVPTSWTLRDHLDTLVPSNDGTTLASLALISPLMSAADRALALATFGLSITERSLFEASTRVIAAALRPGAEHFHAVACNQEAPAGRPKQPVMRAAAVVPEKVARCRRELI